MSKHSNVEVISLERYLALLREQASQCAPGPLKERILDHCRTIQALLQKKVPGRRAEELPAPSMTDAEASKATSEVLTKIMGMK